MASKKQTAAVAAVVKRGRGRPAIPDDIKRKPMTIRLSPRVTDFFQAQAAANGTSWQRDLDDVLNQYVDYCMGITPATAEAA